MKNIHTPFKTSNPRISGPDAATARDFATNNPDCPQFLREAAARDQAGQPGFGPKRLSRSCSLELAPLFS